jgi:hypothetical protein
MNEACSQMDEETSAMVWDKPKMMGGISETVWGKPETNSRYN